MSIRRPNRAGIVTASSPGRSRRTLSLKPKPSRHSGAKEVARGPRPWQAIRAAKVARARRLVRDRGYPAPKILNAVARVLAEHLGPKPGK